MFKQYRDNEKQSLSILRAYKTSEWVP